MLNSNSKSDKARRPRMMASAFCATQNSTNKPRKLVTVRWGSLGTDGRTAVPALPRRATRMHAGRQHLESIRAIRIAIAEDAVGLRAPCGSARERREAALQDVRSAAHAASHKIKARCLDLIR